MEGKTYKWTLRKGSRKEICPNCGKRRFVPYVLTEDNETRCGERYGRCDRENSCGYWVKPYGNAMVTAAATPAVIATPIRFDGGIVRHTSATRTNPLFPFAKWMLGEAGAVDAFSDYCVGQYYGSTIFWQIDKGMMVRSGKLIDYGEDGHRIKERGARWAHKVQSFRKWHVGDTLEQCFFGEHLLFPNKPVAIVESEKTAVIMSRIDRRFTWLACGGSQGLGNAAKNAVLQGFDVTLFPDNGQFAVWSKVAQRHGWNVDTQCCGYPASPHYGYGYDILDLYEAWMKDYATANARKEAMP